MTTTAWIWLFSGAGAALFFGAGMLLAAARRVAVAAPIVLAGGDGDDASVAGGAGDDPTATGGLTWSQLEDRDEGRDLPTTNLQSDLLERVLFAEADARSTRLELAQQVQATQQREAAIAAERAEAGQALAHEGEVRRRSEAAAEKAKAESGARAHEIAELRARVAEAPSTEVVVALRHDLAVAREQARSREASLARLSEEGAGQAARLAELDSLAADCARLKAENGELRARELRGLASGRAAAVPPPPRDVRLTMPGMGLGPSPPGQALQALVDDLTRRRRVRAAVVADELGLVVASSGNNGDELAAAGVVIAHAGAQAGSLLPVGRLRRVSVQDEHDLTITVCPLAAAEGDLSLVTLTLESAAAEPASATGGARTLS
jgi:predicted regulator of Ras-like GTPase activity (Roadblock/LC7/MglB family)